MSIYRDSEEDVDVTENVQRQERKAKKSWWKFWIIPHNIQGHTSLRDVEDGALKLEVSVYEELLPSKKKCNIVHNINKKKVDVYYITAFLKIKINFFFKLKFRIPRLQITNETILAIVGE